MEPCAYRERAKHLTPECKLCFKQTFLLMRTLIEDFFGSLLEALVAMDANIHPIKCSKT